MSERRSRRGRSNNKSPILWIWGITQSHPLDVGINMHQHVGRSPGWLLQYWIVCKLRNMY